MTNLIKADLLFNQPRPLLIAHRGYTPQAPENTLASFTEAARRGFWAIETDVHRTLDGILVCCHNHSLKKMYGADLKIEEQTFKELSGLRVCSGNHVSETDESLLRLPLFDEYLEICAAAGCTPFIETKGAVVGETLAAVEHAGLTCRAVLSSSVLEHIIEARKISKDIFVHHIFTTDETLPTIAELGYCGVSYNYPILDDVPPNLIARVHEVGVRICLRAGDTVDNVNRMMTMGLDYIPTNLIAPQDIKNTAYTFSR